MKINNNTPNLTLPKILNVAPLKSSKLFNLEQVSLQFSNGERREFERLRQTAPGVVLMIPILDSQTILLTREYAVGVENYVLGFPKGRIDQGEDFYQAANREMQEEIGFKANKLTKLKTITSTPNFSAAKMHIILAQDLQESKLPGDEPEPIITQKWPLNKLDELLFRDDFFEARSIAAIYLLKLHLKI